VKISKKGEGHWQFGMHYKNMYALVTPAPLLPILGWIAKFSELKITYDIKFNDETNEVTAETFYTIGQVTELTAYAGLWKKEESRENISLSLGLSAVHFVSIFTSRYKITGDNTGNTVSSGIAEEDVVIGVGEDNHRAFKIGFRGEYDLIDEETGKTIETDENAINILLQAKLIDLGFVAHQLAIAGGLFSIFAYALSNEVQSKYTSPRDLAERSLRPFNPEGFGVHALWYGVCFPSFQGYRIEHDPQYTAYVTFSPEIGEEDEKRTPGFEIVVLIVSIGLIAIISRRNRFKK
jgi:hypothetical protein